MFYRHGPVSVWESTGRSISAAAGEFAGVRVFQSQQVSRMEYRLADGKEPRPDRRSPRPDNSPAKGHGRGVAVNCMPAARVNGSAAFAVMTSTPGKPGRAERWLG